MSGRFGGICKCLGSLVQGLQPAIEINAGAGGGLLAFHPLIGGGHAVLAVDMNRAAAVGGQGIFNQIQVGAVALAAGTAHLGNDVLFVSFQDLHPALAKITFAALQGCVPGHGVDLVQCQFHGGGV